VRARAISRLARLAPNQRDIIAALGRALDDDDAGVRREAVWALASAGALPELLYAVADPETSVARAAERALDRWEFRRHHVPVLVEALRSRRAPVRLRAVEELGRLGADAEEALPALRRLIQGGTGQERGLAQAAMKKLVASAAAATLDFGGEETTPIKADPRAGKSPPPRAGPTPEVRTYAPIQVWRLSLKLRGRRIRVQGVGKCFATIDGRVLVRFKNDLRDLVSVYIDEAGPLSGVEHGAHRVVTLEGEVKRVTDGVVVMEQGSVIWAPDGH
jgi:hypothetical protein